MQRCSFDDVKSYAALFGVPVDKLVQPAHRIVRGFEPNNSSLQTHLNDLYGPEHRVPAYVTMYIRMKKEPSQMPAIR